MANEGFVLGGMLAENGNRASLTENGNTVTYLYDEANQLLSASNGLSFKYDRRGNVIERSQNGEVLNTYIYGANNRLERAVNAKGDMASYSYNGLGRRVSRRAGNTEIDYIFDQTKMYNNLLEADEESFVWDENNLLFRNRETEIRDRLGSPIGMDEFGAKTDADTLGFTGYMYDDISGTYFAQAREYVPEAGRFAGRDIVKGTIQQPFTLNNYNYCYSNPNKYVDWDGRTPRDFPGQNGTLMPDNWFRNIAIEKAENIVSDGWKVGVKHYRSIKKVVYKTQYPQLSKRAKGWLTRNYNKTMKVTGENLDSATKFSKWAGPAIQVGEVAFKTGYNYYKGSSQSKLTSDLAVDVFASVVVLGLACIPVVGSIASVAAGYVYSVFEDDIKRAINSLE